MLSGLASQIQALQGELDSGAAAEKRMRAESHQLMRVEGQVRRAQGEMVAEVRALREALAPLHPTPHPTRLSTSAFQHAHRRSCRHAAASAIGFSHWAGKRSVQR